MYSHKPVVGLRGSAWKESALFFCACETVSAMYTRARRRRRAEMGNDGRQVKSRERVRERGEVFTAEREVKAMCDLVKNETERIDSTFLEPACGDGNFLVEILTRKLSVVVGRYGKSADDLAFYSIRALMSLYGVDILKDNVEACRERLFGVWKETFTAKGVGRSPRDRRTGGTSFCSSDLSRVARFVLEKNVLLGNTLSMKLVDGEGNDSDKPIVFTEWTFPLGRKVKRREYDLSVLLRKDEKHDLLDAGNYRELKGENGMVIQPICLREYPPVDYRRLGLS